MKKYMPVLILLLLLTALCFTSVKAVRFAMGKEIYSYGLTVKEGMRPSQCEALLGEGEDIGSGLLIMEWQRFYGDFRVWFTPSLDESYEGWDSFIVSDIDFVPSSVFGAVFYYGVYTLAYLIIFTAEIAAIIMLIKKMKAQYLS